MEDEWMKWLRENYLRLYIQAVHSIRLQCDQEIALRKQNQKLVEVLKEVYANLNTWHIHNGIPETTKRTKLRERIEQIIKETAQ